MLSSFRDMQHAIVRREMRRTEWQRCHLRLRLSGQDACPFRRPKKISNPTANFSTMAATKTGPRTAGASALYTISAPTTEIASSIGWKNVRRVPRKMFLTRHTHGISHTMSIVPSPQLAKLIGTNEKLLSYSRVTVDPEVMLLLADWDRSTLDVTQLAETNSPDRLSKFPQIPPGV